MRVTRRKVSAGAGGVGLWLLVFATEELRLNLPDSLLWVLVGVGIVLVVYAVASSVFSEDDGQQDGRVAFDLEDSELKVSGSKIKGQQKMLKSKRSKTKIDDTEIS